MTMVSSPTRRSFLKSAGAAVVLAAATPLWLKSADCSRTMWLRRLGRRLLPKGGGQPHAGSASRTVACWRALWMAEW